MRIQLNTSSELKPELTVFISNTSEDVWSFIDSMPNPILKDIEIKENAAFGDLHLCGCVDETELLFISPTPIDKYFLQYYDSLFKLKQLEVYSPSIHTGRTCIDTLNDPELISVL